MKANGGKRKELIDEINITPLTDVFLVLLIIMMVVAPMMKLTRTEIRLPNADGGVSAGNAGLVIEITQDGRYFLEGAEANAGNLTAVLENKLASLTDKELVIRADRETDCRAVLKVFDAARVAQYAKMVIALETLAPGRSSELTALPPLETVQMEGEQGPAV